MKRYLMYSLFKKGNRFKRGNRFGNGGDRFDKGHGKCVGSSRGRRNCYGCGIKNHFIDECLNEKMRKAFVCGSWSDSEDGDQMEKDVTCLMVANFATSLKVSQAHCKGDALDPWISALEQREQRSRGITCKDIYFLPLERY
nr:hypothetical protein [Tanacetum cinerariifolium]